MNTKNIKEIVKASENGKLVEFFSRYFRNKQDSLSKKDIKQLLNSEEFLINSIIFFRGNEDTNWRDLYANKNIEKIALEVICKILYEIEPRITEKIVNKINEREGLADEDEKLTTETLSAEIDISIDGLEKFIFTKN